jgi:hypothetical protein
MSKETPKDDPARSQIGFLRSKLTSPRKVFLRRNSSIRVVKRRILKSGTGLTLIDGCGGLASIFLTCRQIERVIPGLKTPSSPGAQGNGGAILERRGRPPPGTTVRNCMYRSSPAEKAPLGPVSSVMHRIGATAIGVSSAWLEGSAKAGGRSVIFLRSRH